MTKAPPHAAWPRKALVLVLLVALAAGALYVVGSMVLVVVDVFLPDTKTVYEASGPIGWVDRNSSARHPVAFSPDGRTVAYLWIARLTRFTDSQRPSTVAYASQLRWFPVDGPREERAVHLDRLTPGLDGQVHYRQGVRLHFSPDSRRLAAISPNYVTFVDLETGASWKWSFAGEKVSSMAWLSNDEVVYATHSETDQMFWRQPVTATPDGRTCVCRISGKTYRLDQLDDMVKEYWSPNGRLAMIWPRDERFSGQGILRVADGSVRPLNGHVSQFAWKPDSSALVLKFDDGWDKPNRFAWVDYPSGEVTDLTAAFHAMAGDGGHVYFDKDLWGGWTADGRYLLATVCTPAFGGGSKFAGWLIRPQPWQARRVADTSAQVLPVPGWMLTGEGVVDYSGQRRIPTGNVYGWTFSPDGRHAASFSAEGPAVLVHKLDPPLTPQ